MQELDCEGIFEGTFFIVNITPTLCATVILRHFSCECSELKIAISKGSFCPVTKLSELALKEIEGFRILIVI